MSVCGTEKHAAIKCCGHVLRPLILWSIGLAMVGCASGPVVHQSGAVSIVDSEAAVLMNLEAWRMDGRIGVQAKDEAWQAHISWTHEPRQDRLLIQGPLNQGMVSIVLRKGLIYINEGHGEAELSHEPEQTLRKRLGFSVPLYSLRYWLLGMPDPDADSTPTASGFDQSGWSLSIDDLRAVQRYRLPGKLKIQGGDVKLKLVVDDWTIGVQP